MQHNWSSMTNGCSLTDKYYYGTVNNIYANYEILSIDHNLTAIIFTKEVRKPLIDTRV